MASSTPKPFFRRRQTDIFLGSLRGNRRSVPISFDKLKAEAKQNLSAEAYAYIAGSAGTEETKRANSTDFNSWKIVPSMLNDVSACDTEITLFGQRYPTPFLAVAKAAANQGVPFIFSSQASVDMETCSKAMGSSPHWFQLYWSTSDELVKSFVNRAEACGCKAIVLTLDTTMLGWRPAT